jgi:sec-independent protein translocase protein TatC
MNLKKYSFFEHFIELKKRLIFILLFYITSFALCYYFSFELLNFLVTPLAKIVKNHSMIYTSLAEGFISYLMMSGYFAFFITVPVIILQIYLYIKPGLYLDEVKIVSIISVISVLVFYLGMIFVYYLVMPKAFEFFLSFESTGSLVPIKLFARISDYINLTLHFMIIFGLIFEIPLLLATLCLLDIIPLKVLASKRKIVILVAFILGGILTPPDVLSQFALAIPIILLYEISLLILKFIAKKGINHD